MASQQCEECMGRGQRCKACGSYYTDQKGCEECGAPATEFVPCTFCGGEGEIESD